MNTLKSLGSLGITFLTRVEAMWALILLLTHAKTDDNMDDLIYSNEYWIFQIASAFVIFVFVYIVLNKLQKNRERTNIFHWIYNYRFENILEHGNKTEYFDKEELLFMVDKIGRKYSKKSRAEIVKLLKPHYSKFLDKKSDDYINLIGESSE